VGAATLAQSSLRGKRARSHHFPPSYRRLSLEGVVSGCVPLGACFVAFAAPQNRLDTVNGMTKTPDWRFVTAKTTFSTKTMKATGHFER
jgi:hypothetical protein